MANTELNNQQISAYSALGLGPIWFLKQASSSGALAACTKCERKNHRTTVVQTQFADYSSPSFRVLILGTEPAELADQSGQPFAGREHQLIEQMLMSIGIPAGEVSTGYQVKCKAGPALNQQGAALACSDWLKADALEITPTLVFVFGELFDASKAALGDVQIFRLPNVAEVLQSPVAKAAAWQVLRKAAGLKPSGDPQS
jgi:uracil-DNA glycosylase family 4